MTPNVYDVVVTGVGGFIGGHVALKAIQAGLSVSAYSRSNSEELSSHLGAPVTAANILSDELVFPSTILLVHCSTANDVVSRDFEAGVQLSALGTHRVLEAALQAGVQKVVLLSTFQVYGTNPSGEILPSTPPKLETGYALNHFFAEEIGRYFSSRHHVDVTAVRPANLVGLPPHRLADRSLLVPHCFVKDALAYGRISLRSSGLQMRNFVDIQDFATQLAMGGYSSGEGFHTANVGGGCNFTILEVASMVAEMHETLFDTKIELEVGEQSASEENRFTVPNNTVETHQKFSETRMKAIIQKLFELEVKRYDERAN